MQIDEALLKDVQALLDENQIELEALETKEILSVGCSFCGLGCSGIVGGD